MFLCREIKQVEQQTGFTASPDIVSRTLGQMLCLLSSFDFNLFFVPFSRLWSWSWKLIFINKQAALCVAYNDIICLSAWLSLSHYFNFLFFIICTVVQLDERELDIPNGENNAENEEEQEQPEVEEQEFYVEGLCRKSNESLALCVYLHVADGFRFSFYFYCTLFVCVDHLTSLHALHDK